MIKILSSDEVETSPNAARSSSPGFSPETHVFHPATWRKANPAGDLKRAIAKAKAQGYTVIE